MREENSMQGSLALEAAKWYLAHRDGQLTAREREAFIGWLRTSPQHVAEYLALSSIGRDLPGVARSSLDSLEKLKCDALREDSLLALKSSTAPPRRRRATAVAIAASIALFSLVSIVMYFDKPSRFTTTLGEQRVFQLSDSSVVRLNSNSSLVVNFSPQSREVMVVEGQAYFQVARDPSHPFRVRTKSTVLTALGTAFDVYERPDGTRVTVTEGRVGVGEQQLVLAAGDQAHISHAGKIGVTRTTDVSRATAWVRQEIAFEGEPVAEVAREFNRYNRLEIIVDDRNIAEMPISGVFQSYDVASFIEFMDQLPQVRVVEGKGKVRFVAEQ